jgi:hypothetical protein
MHYNVLSFVSFCVVFAYTTEYEQIRRWGAHFLWSRGVKYLNTGLAIASHKILCIFRYAVYIRCTVSIQQVRENGKILGARYTLGARYRRENTVIGFHFNIRALIRR